MGRDGHERIAGLDLFPGFLSAIQYGSYYSTLLEMQALFLFRIVGDNTIVLVLATAVLNIIIFGTLAVPIWLTTRKRWPGLSTATIAVWGVFYLGSLFAVHVYFHR